MRGYPKHIATKHDFLNLLSMPKYKNQALQDLKNMKKYAEDNLEIATVVSGTEEENNIKTKVIDNPSPVYKLKGFNSISEVDALIAEADTNGK